MSMNRREWMQRAQLFALEVGLGGRALAAEGKRPSGSGAPAASR
jgi:hypothetical protein